MTVFNDESFIGQAIESILNQTFTDFEFLIINDGSTDKTTEIIEEYSRKDKRIKIVHQENAGTTVAGNNGLNFSLGKYVARLDSDDISYPNRLQIEVEFLDSHPKVGLVGGGSHFIDMQGNIVGIRNIKTSNPYKTLMHRCIYQQSDVMFRKDIVLQLGGYREKFHNSQDYDLWLRISEVAAIAKLDVVLGQWRLNASGYTYSRKKEQEKEVNVIKQIALLRRKQLSDGYENYFPPEKTEHRKQISKSQYELLLASSLLTALRKKEARKKLLSIRPTFSTTILILFTFMPDIFLRLGFAIRNCLKNSF